MGNRFIVLSVLVMFLCTGRAAMADENASPITSSDRRIQRELTKFYRYCAQSQMPGYSARQQLEAAGRVLVKLERKKDQVAYGVLRSYWLALSEDGAKQEEIKEIQRSTAREFSIGMKAILHPGISSGWTSAADDSRVDRQVAAYRINVALLAAPQWAEERSTNALLSQYCSDLSSRTSRIEKEAAKWTREIAQARLSAPIFNQMLVWQAQWFAGEKLCAQNSITDASHRADSAVATLGSREGARVLRQVAAQKRIASVRMKPAASKNHVLLAQVRNAFVAQKWNERIVAVRITSSTWEIQRAPRTRRILRRLRETQIAVRQGNHCRLYDFTIKQVYKGKSFGRAGRSSHNSRLISCKNIPTL